MQKFSLKALMWATLSMGLGGTLTPVHAAEVTEENRSYWLPDYVRGVKTPVISLNGEWEFRYTADSPWTSIAVPGEAAMQGYAIRHDVPFFYRRTVHVPADYQGNKIILRFDGTYSKARLYVNGTRIRNHHGGFTRWETDITPYVKAGADNELMLELTDPLEDISYASGYAHHPIGGILRDVTLFATPSESISNATFVTDLDSLYRDAVLSFTGETDETRRMSVRLSLFSPEGDKLGSVSRPLEKAGNSIKVEMPVSSPRKWDAEHPHLYQAKLDVLKGNRVTASYTKQVGFREVEVRGNRLLVNGHPVKLCGACRHDLHPTLGRVATAETDSLDAVLFKEANMNFVRTSHYPPTERFLEFCDRYGIYVECETAVCFVNTHRQKNYAPGATQDNPEYAGWYQSQCLEMVRSLRAHPACYTYATLQTDPNIREFWGKSLDMMWSGLFEAPGGLGGAIWGYVDETFALPEPKVGDAYWKEFAHTAKPEGFRGNCVGYGEWGIVDVWRRKKPEFWSTKKAYSPVRLLSEDVIAFTPGMPVNLTVYNRFDHTRLDEIKAFYAYRNLRREVALPAVSPHAKGVLAIPAENWTAGEPLRIEFRTTDGLLIDAYRLMPGNEPVAYPEALGTDAALQVEETDDYVVIKGSCFEIPFNKGNGLIENARVNGQIWIEQGPFLHLYVNLNHLSGAEVRKMADHYEVSAADWEKKDFHWEQRPDGVYVNLTGTYRQVEANLLIRIAPSGELAVDYTVDGAPNGYLRESGVAFRLADAFDRLRWKRDGYWNDYPSDAFAGNEGDVPLFNPDVPAYGQKPNGPWAMDTHNYYYWADRGTNCQHPLTQTAKGMKENIFYYSLAATDRSGSLSVLSSTASEACRINKMPDDRLMLYVNNRWDYPEIAWGNYCKQLEALPCYGQVFIRFSKAE